MKHNLSPTATCKIGPHHLLLHNTFECCAGFKNWMSFFNVIILVISLALWNYAINFKIIIFKLII